MPAPKFAQVRKTTLVGGISAAATSFTVRRLVDAYGNEVDMDDLGLVGVGTINPSGDTEEIVIFTAVTQNSDGTATVSGVSRGRAAVEPYGAGGTAYAQASGTRFVISNNPQHYDAILDYIDGIALAGAPDASTTAKGIVEVATSSEIDSDEDLGATGARVAVTPDQLALSKYGTRLPSADEKLALVGSGGTPASTNKFATQGYDIELLAGSGADGDVTISSPTTLTRDMYYNTLVVNSVLTTDGFAVFVKGQLSGTGTIKWGVPNPGTAGTANASPAGGGAGGAQGGTGPLKNVAGSAGGQGADGGGTSGTAGAAGNPAVVRAGSAGGAGAAVGGSNSPGSGGAGGAQSYGAPQFGRMRPSHLVGLAAKSDGTIAPAVSAGGGGGGGGGCRESGSSSGTPLFGGGGGAGASGGTLVVVCGVLAGTLTFHAAGGAGGAGGASTSSTSNKMAGGGGGGAGGAGGLIIVVTLSKTGTPTYTVTGGAAGAGGAGRTSPENGFAGTSGGAGSAYEITPAAITVAA